MVEPGCPSFPPAGSATVRSIENVEDRFDISGTGPLVDS